MSTGPDTMYMPCYLAAPLGPGEYRTVSNDKLKVCCAGCSQLFELPATAGSVQPPEHLCDGSALEVPE